MARPANQASGSGSTSKAKKPKVKAPAKNRPAGTPTTPGLYGWNGGPKTHTVSQADHEMHVADPLTKDPLYASAKQQATAQYAPQANALTSLQTNAPVWYQNYMNQAKAAGVASAAYAQPVINQAGTFATNVNAPAAGLDPNSAEYQKSVQAGKGLSALATFGQQNLQANQAADQTYFGGQAANAAGALPGVMAGYAVQQGQLGSQVAGRTQEIYQANKQAAVNEDIARQTLNVNTAKAGGYDPITGKKLPAEPASPSAQKTAADLAYFNKHGYYPPTGPPKSTGPSASEQRQIKKDAAAKTKAIQTATGKAKTKVTDIMKAWAKGGTITEKVPDKSQPPNLLTGQPPTVDKARKMTRAELRAALGTKYGDEWVSIMERVRKGVPITQEQIDYLHGTSPDLRVPKEWIKGRTKQAASKPSEPSTTTTGTGKTYRP